MVQKVFRIREAKNGTETDALLQTGTDGHHGIWKMLKKNRTLEDGRIPAKEPKNARIEGQKRSITRKEYQRLVNKSEMESFMAQKGLWNLAREK